jgi:predicted XRE-type DNA-binding protein
MYDNVWDALESDPILRDNLKVRSRLLSEISTAIENSGETQTKIAQRLNITQPRVSALMKGKITKFSVDSLMAIACKLGLSIEITVKDTHDVIAA